MNLSTQLRRFSLQHQLLPPHGTIVVGVSGGADSLCLLHVLKALSPEFDLRLHVAHLDHQLRGADSQADADFVRNIAQQWNLPCTIDSRDVHSFAHHYKLSLEEAARQVRYSFLLEVALAQRSATIAVAHHADDQTETVLMHFLRGSGLAGLRGMLPKMLISDLRLLTPALHPQRGASVDRSTKQQSAIHNQQSKIYLVRPLLDTPRAAIDEYCQQHHLQPRIDATNADTTYFRNRLRHDLLPILATYNPNIRSVLRHTAEVITADYETLLAHTNFAWDMTIVAESDAAITFSLPLWREQPIGTQRALLRRAIQQLRPPLRDIDFVHIENAIDLLSRAQTGAQATLPQNLWLEVSYETFTIAPREELALPDWPLLPERCAPLTVNVPGVTPLPESDWVLEASLLSGTAETAPTPSQSQRLRMEPAPLAKLDLLSQFFATDVPPVGGLTAYLDAATLSDPLLLRPRLSTDRFHPQGMPAPVRLKDWMINVKVPRAMRDRLPLLLAGDHIAWVPGFRVGQPFIVTVATRQIVKFVFRKQEDSSLARNA